MSSAPALVAQPSLIRAADGSAARILATVAALTLGAVAYVSGVAVRRVSLLTYNVAGYALDLAEVPAEVAFLVAEREAIQDEPTLRRAAEVVGRRLLTSRGIDGRFTVRLSATEPGAAPVWTARWMGIRTSPREDRIALEDLAAWARDLGLRVSHGGFQVIATLPPAGPSLAKASRVATTTSRAA